MGKYQVVNPVLGVNPQYENSIKTVFSSNNVEEAAEKFWRMIDKRQLFAGEMLNFYFTMKGGNGSLYHFRVNEKAKDKSISYELENITDEIEQKMTDQDKNQFVNEVSNVQKKLANKQTGGKRKRHKNKDDDDSSSSSSSDEETIDEYFDRIRKNSYKSPIYYWWYAPRIYKVKRIFSPVFVPKIMPYYQLWIPH